MPEVIFPAFPGWTYSQLPLTGSKCQGLFAALLPCSELPPALPPAQKKQGAVGVSSERHQDEERDGAVLLEGKAERTGIVMEKRSLEVP